MTTPKHMPDDPSSSTAPDSGRSSDARSGLDALLSRRNLLRTGGAMSLGLLLAACGKTGGSSAPGRVGDAPPPETPPPHMSEPVSDVELLRTLASLEHTVIDFHDRSREFAGGSIKAKYQPSFDLFDRFVSDHRANAAALNQLATQAGGKPFDCANPWFAERVMPPIDRAIAGGVDDEGEKVKPSDDPQRDIIIAAWALEQLLGMSAQQLIPLFKDSSLRAEAMSIGLNNVRHSAALAIAATGSPDGYADPALVADEVAAPDPANPSTLYAVVSHFGSLAGVDVIVGAATSGIRTTVSLTTPAENSYAYDNLTCKA